MVIYINMTLKLLSVTIDICLLLLIWTE